MIRIVIVGRNYGQKVLLPAFTLDRRCDVVDVLDSRSIEWAGVSLASVGKLDAVALAVPPAAQPTLACWAMTHRLAVFGEKPLADTFEEAERLAHMARHTVTAVDFGFTEVPAFRTAKILLDAGAIGRLRHVTVTWHVENETTRKKLEHWKTSDRQGGGVLGNFASHSLHYLEWLCGPIGAISGTLTPCPDAPALDTTVTASMNFANGASGALTVSCAAFLGSGHRLEFYGSDGTLVLDNSSYDTMRGFTLRHGTRTSMKLIDVDVASEPDRFEDGRIAPVARLVSRFLDRIEGRDVAVPDFAAAARVQALIEAIRQPARAAA